MHDNGIDDSSGQNICCRMFRNMLVSASGLFDLSGHRQAVELAYLPTRTFHVERRFGESRP